MNLAGGLELVQAMQQDGDEIQGELARHEVGAEVRENGTGECRQHVVQGQVDGLTMAKVTPTALWTLNEHLPKEN